MILLVAAVPRDLVLLPPIETVNIIVYSYVISVSIVSVVCRQI